MDQTSYQPPARTDIDTSSNLDSHSNPQQIDFASSNAIASVSPMAEVDTTQLIVKGSGGQVRKVWFYITLISHIVNSIYTGIFIWIFYASEKGYFETESTWVAIPLIIIASIYLLLLLSFIIYLFKILSTKDIIVPIQTLTAEQLYSDVNIPRSGYITLRARSPPSLYYLICFIIGCLFTLSLLVILGIDVIMDVFPFIINTAFIGLSYTSGVDPTVEENKIKAGIIPASIHGYESDNVDAII